VDKALARTSDAPLRTDNQLELLKDGAQTFDDWLAAIGRAERWIHLENYIFVADETGRRFSEALCDKSSSGVSVRFLYDCFGCLDVPRSHWRKMRDAGVDVRVLVPAINDIPWIGAVSRSGYRQFLEAGVRIFEYSGPMIHAKTIVADGWWSKVGSTNLNLSSLGANWEIDLVAEDPAFAKKMEDLFEEDIANSREIHLVEPIKSGRQPQIRPDGPIDSADREARRGARRGVVGSGSGASATVTRVGSAVIQKSGAPLQTHEQAFAVVASAILLGRDCSASASPVF
jgi:phosphatidylserine/phosphatidylglycerophosphate/cardiolipin synthase-like enzyme